MNSKQCTTVDSILMNSTTDDTPAECLHPETADASESSSYPAFDLLLGFGSASCAMLFAALAFAAGSALIALLSAAGSLLLSIRIFRAPDAASRSRRKLTAYLLYFPLTVICGLLGLHEFLAEVLYSVNGGVEFGDLCAAIVLYIPGTFLMMLFAGHYAKKQKQYPVIPLCLMYLLYALCQADAFRFLCSGYLSLETFWLSFNARTDFFELCILTAIDLAVIYALNRRITAGSTSHPKLLTGFAAALCIYNVFIAATTIIQIVVYINYCGLTRKRIYAIGIAVLIAVAFVILLLRQFVKIPAAILIAACCTTAAGMFLCVSPDAKIAEFNIAGYESGSLEELDVWMLCDLSDEAYAVMETHPDALQKAGQWEYFQERVFDRQNQSSSAMCSVS